jgi:predicted DNA-binding ribbon-helix-helix protein
MRLEPDMWDALKDIADYEGCTIHQICSYIALQNKPDVTLTAATRVFLMLYYKNAVTQESRKKFHGHLQNAIREANDNLNSHLRERYIKL